MYVISPTLNVLTFLGELTEITDFPVVDLTLWTGMKVVPLITIYLWVPLVIGL